jgi:hypothetical protein
MHKLLLLVRTCSRAFSSGLLVPYCQGALAGEPHDHNIPFCIRDRLRKVTGFKCDRSRVFWRPNIDIMPRNPTAHRQKWSRLRGAMEAPDYFWGADYFACGNTRIRGPGVISLTFLRILITLYAALLLRVNLCYGAWASGGGPTFDSKTRGRHVLRRCSCRHGWMHDEILEIFDLVTVRRRGPGLRHDTSRSGSRPVSAGGNLFAGAAATRGWGGAVYVFLAGPSTAPEAVSESLRPLARAVRLRRPLRPHLPALFLLSGGGRLLPQRSGILRRRRQPALRDVAVGLSVPVSGGVDRLSLRRLDSIQARREYKKSWPEVASKVGPDTFVFLQCFCNHCGAFSRPFLNAWLKGVIFRRPQNAVLSHSL